MKPAYKSYSEKLRDPRWQRRRLEVMESDGWTCQCCGCTDKTLNVHHRLYRKSADVWDYEHRELVTVCEDCHKKWESAKSRLDKMFLRIEPDAFLEMFSDKDEEANDVLLVSKLLNALISDECENQFIAGCMSERMRLEAKASGHK